MAGLIEDYAIIGNCEAAALVGRDGSMDWLGLPRFDSAACFAALLGTAENGRWQIAPSSSDTQVSHRYRPGSLILETEFETRTGAVRLTDCMGRRDGGAEVVRLVQGVRGEVLMRMELIIRPGYGSVVPWVRRLPDGRVTAVAGPDRFTLATSAEVRGEGMATVAEFLVSEGEEVPFSLTWSPSYKPIPGPIEASTVLETVKKFWRDWSEPHTAEGGGEWSEAVLRSAITLKALAHFETGGILRLGCAGPRPGSGLRCPWRPLDRPERGHRVGFHPFRQ